VGIIVIPKSRCGNLRRREHVVGTVGRKLLLLGCHVPVGEAVSVLGGELGYGDTKVVFIFGRVFELGWVVSA